MTNKPEFYRSPYILISLFIVFILLCFCLSLLTNENLSYLFTSQTALREKILSYGSAAPLVIIAYQIIQVVVAPLPGQAIDMANGYIFGVLQGSFNSLTGIFIGSFLAIYLARRFGQPLVSKLLGQQRLEKIHNKIGHKTFWFFVLLFLIPGTPDDFICFLVGLTSISFSRGVLAAVLGRTPSILAAVVFGATGRSFSPVVFILVAAGASSILYLLIRYMPKFRKYRDFAGLLF